MELGEKICRVTEWRVLALQGEQALLMTEAIIEQRPYNDEYVTVTWADCSLRQYLNGAFYESLMQQNRLKSRRQLTKILIISGTVRPLEMKPRTRFFC